MLRLFCVVLALLAAMAVPASAMDFRLLQSRGQRAILALGPINPGDAPRLAAALSLATRDKAGTKELLLDSPGGSVDEALAMAEIMDRAGVRTVVPAGAMCGSACASVLFVSGKYRSIDKGGVLAIHSCYDALSGRQIESCNEQISAHAEYEGASGQAMMALQQAAGTHAAFVFDNAGATCFGLTRAPGARARHSAAAPCLEAALKGARRR
jgi:hypothetical protein